MKINVKEMSYEEVLKLPRLQHKMPMKPQAWLMAIVRLICISTLKKTKFSYTTERMELVKDQPCLILMNHSAFIDLKIAFKIFYPMPFCTVCTSDGFVGKR